MSDFKLCENGHYFPQSLDDCPYCPKSSSKGIKPSQFKGGSDLEKTMLGGGIDNSLDKTQIFGGSGGVGGSNLNKTQIFGNSSPTFGGSPFKAEFEPSQPSVGRKLVGWLVSFTLDPNGADYKLYEGRNSIGADGGCDIVVMGDGAVSSRHLTILHRMGHFKFKDELSTNGTFINDVFEEEGNLKDGDIIRIGDTIFKFRSIA
jgi:hypothetical protein